MIVHMHIKRAVLIIMVDACGDVRHEHEEISAASDQYCVFNFYFALCTAAKLATRALAPAEATALRLY